MKKTLLVFLCGLAFCYFSTMVTAENFKGEILDVFDDNSIAIQCEQVSGVNMGDQIDLTYMAGVLPMAIGVYEVSAAQGYAVIAKPISTSMGVNKGMTVEIDILKGGGSAVKEIEAPNVTGKSVVQRNQPQYVEIIGEVSNVMGDDIEVAIEGNMTPSVDWLVDVFYVTKGGNDLPIGTWKVKKVNGQKIIASKDVADGDALKGFKAIVYNKKKKVGIDVDAMEERVDYLLSSNNAAVNIQKSSAQPLQLLGQAATESVDVVGEASSQENIDFFLNSVIDFDESEAGDSAKNIVKFNQYIWQLKKQFPPNDSSRELQAVLQTGRAIKWWLGARVGRNESLLGQTYYKIPTGVRVVSIFKGSPAEKAGLQVGDIIYSVNETATSDAQIFTQAVATSDQQKIELELDRKYKRKILKIKLQKVK